MVRIKRRYLLVNIIYLDAASSSAASYPPQVDHFRQLPHGTLPAVVDFHRPSPDHLTSQVLLRLLRETIADVFGDWGVGAVGTGGGLSVKYFSPATSTAIIRCPRAFYRLVWAALTYITHLPATTAPRGMAKTPRPCVMRVVRVSGTIRKAEEEVIRRAREDILRAKRGGDGLVLGGGGGSERLMGIWRGGKEGEMREDEAGDGEGIEDVDVDEDEDDEE